MTPAELERIGRRMYGVNRWRSKLALNLGFDTATIHRWKKRERLTYVVEVAVRGLLEKHQANVLKEKKECERLRRAGKLRPKLRRRKVKDAEPIIGADHGGDYPQRDHAED